MENNGRRNGWLPAVGDFSWRKPVTAHIAFKITGDHVLLPGFMDCHTHLFRRRGRGVVRIQGETSEIAKAGDVWVRWRKLHCRRWSCLLNVLQRVERHLAELPIEVKSLERSFICWTRTLKQLGRPKAAASQTKASLVATCPAPRTWYQNFAFGSTFKILDHIFRRGTTIVKANRGYIYMALLIPETLY